MGNTIGGALIGAIIGGAAGGGGGAAIGAVAGGGAGTVASGVTNPEAWIPAEALVIFHITAPVTVDPVNREQAMRLAQGLYYRRRRSFTAAAAMAATAAPIPTPIRPATTLTAAILPFTTAHTLLPAATTTGGKNSGQ